MHKNQINIKMTQLLTPLPGQTIIYIIITIKLFFQIVATNQFRTALNKSYKI